MTDSRFSEAIERIDSSQIRRVFDLAATLKNPINLSIGQPHFPTPEPIVESIHRAMVDGKTAYTTTQGIPELRERLSRKFREVNGFHVEPGEILVSTGISSLLQLLFQSVLNPGDRVLTTDPCFLIYRSMFDFFNVTMETVPEEFQEEDLKQVPTEKLKLIIYSSPSNPSGFVMDPHRIQLLGNLAEKSGAWLVSDEIYETFDYEGSFRSAASIYPRAVTLFGFSKGYSMTGLRLGVAAGPEELIQRMTRLQQYTVVCAPAPVQWGALTALDLDMSSSVDSYRKNRDYCVSRLKGVVSYPEPGGAFYLYPDIEMDALSFVERAIKEKELLIVPGSIFSRKKSHVRISYATEPSTLERGMDALLELLESR